MYYGIVASARREREDEAQGGSRGFSPEANLSLQIGGDGGSRTPVQEQREVSSTIVGRFEFSFQRIESEQKARRT